MHAKVFQITKHRVNEDDILDENTLTVNINRLRKKLDLIGIKELISTKFGEGYIIKN